MKMLKEKKEEYGEKLSSVKNIDIGFHTHGVIICTETPKKHRALVIQFVVIEFEYQSSGPFRGFPYKIPFSGRKRIPRTEQ